MTAPGHEIAAVRVCARDDRDFRELFRRQYFLTREEGLCPDGWAEKAFRGWRLCHCPDLPVVEITDDRGAVCGLFIGIGIGPGGGVFAQAAHVPARVGTAGCWPAAERVIEGLAGRYLALLGDGEDERVYFDPVCDMAAVHDPVRRVVASSLLLCLHRDFVPNRRMPCRGPAKGRHNYALWQTPDRDVTRAMANHYLCLRSFAMVRHFPKGDEVLERPGAALEEVSRKIGVRLSEIMDGLLGAYRCVFAVTGGMDSRVLLACGGGALDKVHRFFAHHANGKASGFDCMLAQQLGERLGFDVEIVDTADPHHVETVTGAGARRIRSALRLSSGFQSGGFDAHYRLAPLLAPEGDVLIRGNVMDVMRANQYRRSGKRSFELAHGLGKLGVGPQKGKAAVAEWGPDYMGWAETLPANAQARIPDFAFCELLLPNTMGGWLVAQGKHFYINPFSDRGLICLAASLDPKVRQTTALHRTVIDVMRPELGEIPFQFEYKEDRRNHVRYRQQFRKRQG